MSAEKIRVSDAIKALKKEGVEWDWKNELHGKRFVDRSDIEAFQNAVAQLGFRQMNNLLECYEFAIDRNYIAARRQVRSFSLFSFFKVFTTPLQQLIHDPKIAAKGYRMSFYPVADNPLPFNIELASERGRVARVNFDLFLSKEGPGVIIGNSQGGRLENMQLFISHFGMRPLEYFLKHVKEVIPNPAQRRVLNPKRHQAYRKPDPETVAEAMYEQGRLSRDDLAAFRRGIRDKINVELERMKTVVTGAHVSAFKGAGYKKSKKRFWRPK